MTHMYLDERARQAVEEILRRGGDVQVQRKGNGVIVLEIKKTKKYSSAQWGAGKGNESQLLI